MKVLISRALIDSNIIHDDFVLINDMMKKILWFKGRNSKF